MGRRILGTLSETDVLKPDKWLRLQRQRVINFLLGLIVVVGFFATAYAIYGMFEIGRFSFPYAYYIITYIVIVLMFIIRRIPDDIRALAVLVVFYAFAFLALLSGWLSGGGRVFLLMLVPVASVLLSPRFGFTMAGLSLLTFAGFGLAYTQGWMALPPLADFADGTVVFFEGVGFTLALAIVVASMWFVRQALLASARANEQTAQANRLLDERATQLEQANQALITAREEADQQRRLAEEANWAKSQFLASVSHELRTPLNAIINFSQFVSSGLHGPVNEKQVDALGKTTSSARHLLALINDVLDMSKIESGRLELFLEEDVDLCPEIRQVLDTTRTLLEEKPVELIEDIAGDLPRLRVDRRRIRQVLLNLTSNAAKFTREGHIALRVSHADGQVLFVVEDTGPGIDPEQQALIFEPFRQLDRSTQTEGTGLGLPIARQLVEAHGGRLWLESTPGSGATFYVSLPEDHSASRLSPPETLPWSRNVV
nr:hypothetical protein [Anaerolineae bacterium]